MQPAAIPAWKRLGLKLKSANNISDPIVQPINNEHVSTSNGSHPEPSNRDQLITTEPPRKRQRTSTVVPSASPTRSGNYFEAMKLRKNVSFSADTKHVSESPIVSPTGTESKSEESAVTLKKVKTKTKSKSKSKKSSQPPLVQKSNTALDYLHQFNSGRSTWKFNKNKETWILKHALSEADVPRDYDVALARYIHGLQGSRAREMLKDQCVDLLKRELDGKDEEPNTKKIPQQGLDQGFLERFKTDLEQPYNENGETNDDYSSWIQRQPRATILLWSLELDPAALLNGDKRVKAKEKKRKNRTAVVEYDSSSSESESESDNSSDSDSDSDSNVNTESDAKIAVRDKAEEETSSSGSDSEDSDGDSDVVSASE